MMKKKPQSPKSDSAFTEGQREAIRDLLEDIYVHNKWHIARTNFLRGVFFGFGTFLGGTIVVAVVIWILTRTIDLFPWAQNFTQSLIDSLGR
ncbi:DUF5665 domain-containing protein [Candidatus Saccharibacteria bacterium]|nr:DUF5665 domain-containing protein [Candidatus Saccharibacteria bacterium]